jgi:hypothetical protein
MPCELLSRYVEYCILVQERVIPGTDSSGLYHIVDLRPAVMPHDHVSTYQQVLHRQSTLLYLTKNKYPTDRTS